jgi:hypothetical protein
MDGAEWQRGFVDRHRRDAVRILDFPHAVGYLAKVAEAGWRDDPARRAAWLDEQRRELRDGDPQRVLGRVRALQAALAPAAGAAGSAAWQAVTTGLTYLEKRQDHLRYAAFAAAGYPLGSGAVESANKLVVEARLKGAGMHWAPAHVTPMVALRTVAGSDRWEEAWPQIAARARRRARGHATARRHARRAPAPPRTPPVSPASPVPASVPPPAPLHGLPTGRHDPAPPAAPPPPPISPADAPRRPAPAHPWRRRRPRPRAVA